MSMERDPLDELIGSVSDGERVDWDATLRALPRDSRSGAQNLRQVARIAAFHRELQHPRSAPAAEATHWGPLLLLERLGSGASADVYRAWDPQLRREVALKILRQKPARSLEPTASPLIEEGRAAARIRHPHVVTVHGIDVHDGQVGLWMELIAGKSLEYLLERHGPLSPPELTRLARELGAALAAVHAAGLLHRDLKPANVVRDQDGRYILTDFGLGLRADGVPSPESWHSGTPMYMAPELLRGGAPSVHSDLYALGMLLRYAAVGQHAFATESLQELRAKAARGPEQSLQQLRGELAPQLIAAIEACMQPEPSQRCASAAAFLAALPPTDSLPRRSHGARRKRRWILPGLGAAAAAVLFTLWLSSSRDGAQPLVAGYDVSASFLRRSPDASVELAQGDAVAPGDHLSLRLRVSRASWVYVLNEDDRGERYLLYPQPRFELQNPLSSRVEHVLPGPSGGAESVWTVTSVGGREHFLVVVSPEPVRELEAELAALPAPEKNAPIEYAPIAAATIERLRGVGGLDTLPAAAARAGSSPLFEHFRALAGRESQVNGVWVRHFLLHNSS